MAYARLSAILFFTLQQVDPGFTPRPMNFAVKGSDGVFCPSTLLTPHYSLGLLHGPWRIETRLPGPGAMQCRNFRRIRCQTSGRQEMASGKPQPPNTKLRTGHNAITNAESAQPGQTWLLFRLPLWDFRHGLSWL